MMRYQQLLVSLSLLAAAALHGAHADTWNEQTHKALTGDFNGDGLSDLFLQPKQSGEQVQILLGLGDTNYTPPIQQLASSSLGINWLESASVVVSGDFDGDGYTDLLVQPRSGSSASVLLANVDGSFNGITHSLSSVSGIDWSYTASEVVVGDFDGDSRDDVLLQTKTQSGQSTVLITDTSGRPASSAQQTIASDHLGYNWSKPYRNLIAGDFNGDGRDDLLLQERIAIVVVPLGANGAPMPIVFKDDAGHALLLASATGTFDQVDAQWQNGHLGLDWDDRAVTIHTGDFNNDGITDLLLQGSGGTHRILHASTLAQFTIEQTWSDNELGANWSPSSSKLLFGDVNGDGRTDVLIQPKGTSTATKTALAVSGGTLAGATASNWSEPPLSATNYAVGTLAGQTQVGPGGGASYSVPIVVPPGVGGMQPDISLQYSSQGGSGIGGVGWAIGGLSSVHRCGKSFEQDGAHEGLKLDTSDRLCLDGVRLVAVSGGYGATDTEYRTEIDSYSKIVQNDSGCGYACGFTVYTKAGQIFQYGVTGDAIQNLSDAGGSPTAPLSWAVSKISDTVGNAIDFAYTEIIATGEHRIASIIYNHSNGLSGSAKVEFDYDPNRPDPSYGYLLGSKLESYALLTTVRTKYNGAAIKEYRVSYKTGAPSGNSLVDTVQECAFDNLGQASCLVPSRFTWSEKPARLPEWDTWGDFSTVFDLRRCQHIVQGDANGDGLTDLICAYDTDLGNANAIRTYVQLANGNGYDNWVSWYNGPKDWAHPYRASMCTQFNAGDFNGDGLTDLVCNYMIEFGDPDQGIPPESKVYVQLSQGNSYSALQPWDESNFNAGLCRSLEVGDVNADGLSDIICPHGGLNLEVQTSNGSTFSGWQTWANTPVNGPKCRHVVSGDADGDGRTDVMCAYDSSDSGTGSETTHVWYSQGNGFTHGSWGTNAASLDLEHCRRFTTADVNGDGLTDMVCPAISSGDTNVRMYVQLSKGFGFAPWMEWQVTPTSSHHIDNCRQFIPADVDGDGNQDLLCPYDNGNTTTTFVMRSTGAAFGNWEAWSSSTALNLDDCRAILPTDSDGNGKVDIACVHHNGSGGETTYVQADTGLVGDLLLEIEDGAGASTHIDYKPLTDTSVYTRDSYGNCPGYPTLCLQAPMYVVSGLSASDGIGGLAASGYHYKFGRANALGRAWLGFGEVESTDYTTGITTRTVYNQEFSEDTVTTSNARKAKFAKTGLPVLSETRANGTLIKKTGSVWNVVPQNAYSRFELQAVSSTETSYELDGSPVTTVLTSNGNYDAYGNVGQVSVTTTDAGNGEIFTTVTDNVYYNDTVNWFLGRLTHATATNTTPTATGTRTSDFEYDPQTGLLTAEIVEKGNADLELRTEYGYIDPVTYLNHGNKTSVTVKDSGSAQYPISERGSTTRYDYSGLSASPPTYTVTSTNAKGHSEVQTIDARFGVATNLVGPNGLPTGWTYDKFGRQTREDRADGTSTTTTHAWCDNDCPPLAVRKTTTSDTTAADVVAYFDLLGREVSSETTGLNGRTILADTQYDNRGQVKSASRNYFAGNTSYWTDTEYDVLGRVTKVISPDGGEIRTEYNGLTTTIIQHDLNGEYTDQTVEQVRNALGQEVQIIDEALQTLSKEYDAFGNLVKTTDPDSNSVVMAYDTRGRKSSMDDPDMGHWDYLYDALDQLRWQRDAKGQVVTMEYDVLGRITKRYDPESPTPTVWTYDTGNKGIGKLAGVVAPNGFNQSIGYDGLGRPEVETRIIDGQTLSSTTGYDLYGRVSSLTYPRGFQVGYSYNVFGYQDKVYNTADPAEVYWEVDDSDADGNVVMFTLGNGLQTVRLYEPFSGRLQGISTGMGSGSEIQYLTYGFDSLGNLRERVDHNQALTETFYYEDNRNRLTRVDISGVGSKTYAYDALGNFQQKGAVSDYEYGTGITNGAGPHAVTKANGQIYSYDANGNMVGGAGRSIAWTSFNKPSLITKGGSSVGFDYGPDRARFKQTKTVSGATTTTLYYDKVYEQITQGGSTDRKHYISTGGETVAIYTKKGDGSETTRYLHQDHLGSTDVVTEGDPAKVIELLGLPGGVDNLVLERSSFGPFGMRRNVDWSDATGFLTLLETTRGYTGHEQLDEVGLIHMNGRVYDPELGRFLSADPQVQFASNLQSYNRYSYVHNNPLSFTDPSGFGIWKKLKKGWKKFKRGVKKFFSSSIVQYALRAAAYVACGGGPTGSACSAGASVALARFNGESWSQSAKIGAVSFVRAHVNGGPMLPSSGGLNMGCDDCTPGEWGSQNAYLLIAVKVGGDAVLEADSGKNKSANGANTESYRRLHTDDYKSLHKALDVISWIPIIGSAAAAVDAAVYAVEGDFQSAGLAVTGIIGPVGKVFGKGLRVVGKGVTKGGSNGASNVNAQAALRAKLSGLEKAQQSAARTRQLPDGRVRYYTKEVSARTEGPTRGASFVTEHNPKTGQVRQWMESYNHSSQVNRVHPKSLNGQTLNSQHYPPTARELAR